MIVKMRLYNKTNHVLTIKRGLTLAPKGSIVRELEYTDHIKRLERNGFLAVTIYPNSTTATVQNVEDTAKKSRKSSKDVSAEVDTSADNN